MVPLSLHYIRNGAFHFTVSSDWRFFWGHRHELIKDLVLGCSELKWHLYQKKTEESESLAAHVNYVGIELNYGIVIHSHV